MPTLLVSVDFSKGTQRLLATASEIAKELGAGLLLIHVVEPSSAYIPIGPAIDAFSPPPIEMSIDTTELQENRLQELAKGISAEGMTVDHRVFTGIPAEEILAHAEICKPRFIVLGSHGHGELYHLFSGSVVNGVLKHAKHPVLVVPVNLPEDASSQD